MVDYIFKAKCVAASEHMTSRDIYETMYLPEYGNTCTLTSFRRRLAEWKHLKFAETDTLMAGTYPNFIPHNATVQVDAHGNVTQAWIKQHPEIDWSSIKDFLASGVKKSRVKPTTLQGETMLEIPLFDLHFGIATLETYQEELSELLGIISEKIYDEIHILIGQDLLHNNDMRGHTAKRTLIEVIDFQRAWEDAWHFLSAIIDNSIHASSKIFLHYSKGNHDECPAWCLFKALEAAYPQCNTDDSLAPRKCIFWRGCFIGFGHCEYTSKNSLLFQNFVLDFPKEFADAKVREIHSGHLHRESIDEGMMVRRLPSSVPEDKWSSDNGYVGAHKRFQVFEWAENRLKAIYYI